MCKHGDEVILSVPMPAGLSHTGEFRWAQKGIDKCIAPIVQALNDDGIYTANCCCGHGECEGSIHLHDGRILRIEGIAMSNETKEQENMTGIELIEVERQRQISNGLIDGYNGCFQVMQQRAALNPAVDQ